MFNDISAIIVAGGQDKTFGVQKLYFSHKRKLLWEYQYDFLIDIVPQVIICGLDSDPKATRLESLAEALRLVNTRRVLVLDLEQIFLTHKDLEIICSKKKPSVTLCKKSEANMFCKSSLSFIETDSYLNIIPVQLFDTSLIKNCIYNNITRIKNKNTKDFCSVLQKYANIVPELVYADSSSAKRLVDRTDIKFLNTL